MVYLCLSLIHCIILSLLFPHRLFLTIKSDAKHCHNIGYFGMPFLKPRCGQFYIIFNRTLCANTNAHTEPFPLQSIEICLGCTKVQVQCGNEHLLSRDNPLSPSKEMTNEFVGSSSQAWRDLSEPVLVFPYRNVHHQHNAATHTLSFVKQAEYFYNYLLP